ncbi:MAG: hypothetical protein Q7R87_03960 [Nanoarchaeota archaeon]|nr:hypothetical protein [Nanoarchaeota archaeon]
MKKQYLLILAVILIMILSLLLIKYNNIKDNAQMIKKCTYDGKTVYYKITNCCDNYNSIYNVWGKLICSPDGGITGKGDGRCMGEISDCTTIWEK